MTRTARVFLFASVTALAQSAAAPAFEVASIKLNRTELFGSRLQYLPGGRLRAMSWVKQLIWLAYGVKDYQVIGGPGWTESDRFDIDAKAANPDATKEEMRLMLQTLLADRFQLKLRHEDKEFQVYALTVARNGPKIQPLKEGQGGTCGAGFNRDGYFGCKVSMAQLAEDLRHQLQRPILDKTGLEGLFDFKLNYDQYALANKTPPPDFDQPPLLTAIQEQLGLKLDGQKASLPVLVIESIQRPTDN